MIEPDPDQTAALQQQRQAILLPAPLYVQACPGAGKTRVIVDRQLSATSGGRGRAVVSFTNVACAEVTHRCREAGKPELATFPHYVGTLDTFLWRYLVRPFLRAGRNWHRLDSWDRIDAEVTVGSGPNRYTVRLNDFQWSRTPGESTCTAKLQQKKRNWALYAALARRGLLDLAGKQAVVKRNELCTKGYLTGHEIRIEALHTLRVKHDHAIAMLASRFEEIVIDEAQDCSSQDLAILEKLHNADIPLVFVCDPDQAIYEFRGAQPKHIRAFGNKLASRVDLTGNWRSSPAICALASTLRPTQQPARKPDVPVGPWRNEPAGILLVSTSNPQDANAAFAKHADGMAIDLDHRLVLAHAATTLPAASPASSPQAPANYSARVAWATALTRSAHGTPALRSTAQDILQRALLRFWFTNADTEDHSVAVVCEHLGIDTWHLSQQAARLAADLPDLDMGTFSDWCSNANTQLKLHPPQNRACRSDLSGSLKAPPALKNKSPRLAVGVPAAAPHIPLRASVVHQVKGQEEDAVLVIIPDEERTDRLVEAWTSGAHPCENAESLRVLYVAATRARRLLAIALPEDAHTRLATLLKTRDIPFEITLP